MTERLLVDFDNTLTEENVAYWNGERPEPDDDVVSAVTDKYHEGWTVIVWTARPWDEASRIAAHLTEWGIPYHGIRCEKGSGDVYVDDKAVKPDLFVSRHNTPDLKPVSAEEVERTLPDRDVFSDALDGVVGDDG